MIGSVSIRIQRNEPNSVNQNGFTVAIRSVGQPDLHLRFHCDSVEVEDLKGNGHPVPENAIANNLTS